MPSSIILGEPQNRKIYSNEYVDQIFVLWYSLGKPTPRQLYAKMPPYEAGGNILPEIATVAKWILNDFNERAKILDAQVMEQVNAKMIAEKVEMLNRHAEISTQMQDIATEYLLNHKDDLGVGSAVRLLVAGIEIERESRGIATTVEKITRMSDQDLENEIQKLIERAPTEMQPFDSEFVEDADNSGE